MAESPEVLDSDFVLIKHKELHGDNPDVQPSRVPYSAWRSLWSERGFELCDATGAFVTDHADALEHRQDALAAARVAAAPKAARTRAATATQKEG
jgi:hypothetical protein